MLVSTQLGHHCLGIGALSTSRSWGVVRHTAQGIAPYPWQSKSKVRLYYSAL